MTSVVVSVTGEPCHDGPTTGRNAVKRGSAKHTKRCPRCRQMIEKNLGCPHMRCKCGHSFRWTSISPDEPCCQLHIMEGIRYHGLKKGVWGAPPEGQSASRGKLLAEFAGFKHLLSVGVRSSGEMVGTSMSSVRCSDNDRSTVTLNTGKPVAKP